MAGERYEPLIGDWYKDEQGVSFEVITVDAEEQLIEIQYFDGSVEELDFESWRSALFTPRQPPEEWPEPLERLLHDLGREEERVQAMIWSGPLDAAEMEMEWGD